MPEEEFQMRLWSLMGVPTGACGYHVTCKEVISCRRARASATVYICIAALALAF